MCFNILKPFAFGLADPLAHLVGRWLVVGDAIEALIALLVGFRRGTSRLGKAGASSALPSLLRFVAGQDADDGLGAQEERGGHKMGVGVQDDAQNGAGIAE